MLIDSHCHIDATEFDSDREETISRAKEADVEMMLVVGTGDATDFENFTRVVDLAENHEKIFASVGVHPHDAKTFGDEAERRLIELAKSSQKVIAWGEIGLDFFYEHSAREIQKEVFRRQIIIAREIDLPIIIHSRDADSETVEILMEECTNKNFRGGIMHCFGGTPQMAEKMMNIGFLISFAGNITFKKAENLRESAKVVPLDKLLIETDSPYLAPVPYRGKRNEPAFVVETAKFLANFYNISLKDLAQATTENFLQLFRIQMENKYL
ncbi:MAG: TatD family hydrolase [Acidobacteriota bacterium]|jgi:TatD DNase family protein|nr:TatD family hydrolase [Acidobacteriota bacterium]